MRFANSRSVAREAEIISHAGEKNSITLATNMAGRGTDIKITDEVRNIESNIPEDQKKELAKQGITNLNGLCVLGTERHESRRIDNQLRGRSGRQGDPGFSRFYVSFDDTLLIRFAADSIRNYIEKNFGEEALEARMITNVITSAQKKIEGQNFDTRKSLLEYDDVLAKQRQIVYDKRDRIIDGRNIDDIMDDIFKTAGDFLAKKSVPSGSNDGLVSGDLLVKQVEPRFLPTGTIKPSLYDEAPIEDIGPDLAVIIRDRFDQLLTEWDVDEEDKDKIKRSVVLHCIDQNWTKHIDSMARLRETIFLRSYANVNPLQDYVNEGYAMFRECLELASVDAVLNLVNIRPQRRVVPQQEQPAEEKPADNQGE